MMEQGAKTFDLIPEFVKQHKPDTGIMLPLRGVSIKRDGGLEVLVDKEGNQIPCFAGPQIRIEQCDEVNLTVTYHGEFFNIYGIKKLD